MAASSADVLDSAVTAVCEVCGAPGAVEYTESLFSPKSEGIFCSDGCANTHQQARLGRLLKHREASR